MNISSVVPSSDMATDSMTDFEKVDRVRRTRSADTCLFWLPSGAYTRSFWIGIFHIGNFCFWVLFSKQLLLRNCAVDFVEICSVYVGKTIIKAAKRIFNSDKICRRPSYSDLNFGVTFFGTQCIRPFTAIWSHFMPWRGPSTPWGPFPRWGAGSGMVCTGSAESRWISAKCLPRPT